MQRSSSMETRNPTLQNVPTTSPRAHVREGNESLELARDDEDEPPTLRLLTASDNAAFDQLEEKVSSPPAAIAVAETTLAAVAGGALGTVAGPLGVVAGACIGLAAGSFAFLAAQDGDEEKSRHDHELDDER